MFYKLVELFDRLKLYWQEINRSKIITIDVGPIELSDKLDLNEKKYFNMLLAYNLLKLEDGVNNENNTSSYIVLCTYENNIKKLNDTIEPEAPYYILEQYSEKKNLHRHLETSSALNIFREFKKKYANFNDINSPIKVPIANKSEGVNKTIEQFISELTL